MSNVPSGLSDALRQLSEGEHLDSRSQNKDALEPIASGRRPSQKSAFDAFEDGEPSQASASSRSGANTRSSSTSGSRPKKTNHADLKKLSVPVLAATGGVLLLIGLWAILILTGASVPLHTRPGADTMATYMLIMLPLSIAMFGGAGFFYWQLEQDKKADEKTGKPEKSRSSRSRR